MSQTVPRPLLSAGYGIGAMLLVLPVAELSLRFFPMQPGAVNWRFGAAGLLSNAVVLPVIGMAVLMATASLMEQRLMVRVASVVNLLGGLALWVVSVFFVLDALQLRGIVRPEMARSYDVAAAKALLSLLLAGAVALWLAVGGWRATRLPRGSAARAQRSADRAPSEILVRRPDVAAH